MGDLDLDVKEFAQGRSGVGMQVLTTSITSHTPFAWELGSPKPEDCDNDFSKQTLFGIFCFVSQVNKALPARADWSVESSTMEAVKTRPVPLLGEARF